MIPAEAKWPTDAPNVDARLRKQIVEAAAASGLEVLALADDLLKGLDLTIHPRKRFYGISVDADARTLEQTSFSDAAEQRLCCERWTERLWHAGQTVVGMQQRQATASGALFWNGPNARLSAALSDGNDLWLELENSSYFSRSASILPLGSRGERYGLDGHPGHWNWLQSENWQRELPLSPLPTPLGVVVAVHNDREVFWARRSATIMNSPNEFCVSAVGGVDHAVMQAPLRYALDELQEELGLVAQPEDLVPVAFCGWTPWVETAVVYSLYTDRGRDELEHLAAQAPDASELAVDHGRRVRSFRLTDRKQQLRETLRIRLGQLAEPAAGGRWHAPSALAFTLALARFT